MSITLDDLKADRALAAAFIAANGAAGVMVAGDASPRGDWPQLHPTPPASPDLGFHLARMLLAPFVRENPTAPPEALYRHARMAGVHSGHPDAFASGELPIELRFAYEIFASTLLAADAILKRERERLAQHVGDRSKRPMFDGETIFDEQIAGAGDMVTGLGKLSKVTPAVPKQDDEGE